MSPKSWTNQPEGFYYKWMVIDIAFLLIVTITFLTSQAISRKQYHQQK